MKAMKTGLLNKGDLTNYLLWLGRCEKPCECFWIPERSAWPWRFACLVRAVWFQYRVLSRQISHAKIYPRAAKYLEDADVQEPTRMCLSVGSEMSFSLILILVELQVE